jgi:rubrerythrin
MNRKLSAEQVLTMATQIERNGVAFYRAAAARAATPDVRDRLLELADMEGEHEGHFEAMKRELTGRELSEPAVNDRMAEVLEAMANGHVFDIRKDPESLVTGRETPEEVYRIAIGLEKEAVAFFTALKHAVPVKQGRARLDAMILEEFGHMALLGQAIQALRHDRRPPQV